MKISFTYLSTHSEPFYEYHFIMRLSRKEIEVILSIARKIYGESVKVYLFGSRTDDSKKGGDIDLLVRTPEGNKGVLKEILGDQKIDIIGDHETSHVAMEALNKGILLS